MTKILVIDDEPSIVNLVTAYLKPEGYEAFTATDGPSGLKAARAYKPDLIILDLMLPGMDGIELLPDGKVLATDWMVGKLMTVAPNGAVNVLVNLHQGSADVGYISKKQIALLPMMMDGTVIAYQLKSP